MRQMRGVLALTLLVAATSVHGWGAMFNRWGGGTHGKGGSRYNPGFNYDTSGQYYNMLTKSEQGVEEPSSRVLEAPIQELLRQEEEDNDPCHQRKCTSNEHCCDGHVCVDTQNSVTGSCLPVFGKKEGEICYRDTDCETGFLCMEGLNGRMECQPPAPGAGKFGEECRSSNECNIHLGLCCRLQRRQKMQPKKLCTYYTDPEVCIGPVASAQNKRVMQHTAGEKRMSAHPDHSYLRYKR
jgi:hypothetical protein